MRGFAFLFWHLQTRDIWVNLLASSSEKRKKSSRHQNLFSRSSLLKHSLFFLLLGDVGLSKRGEIKILQMFHSFIPHRLLIPSEEKLHQQIQEVEKVRGKNVDQGVFMLRTHTPELSFEKCIRENSPEAPQKASTSRSVREKENTIAHVKQR